jgi:putative zinc finger protein
MEEHKLRQALQPSAECLSIEQLGRYADDVLAPIERGAADAHVRGCANCRTELALMESFRTLSVRDDEAAIVRSGVEQLNRRRSEIFGDTRHEMSFLRRFLSIGALRPALAMATVLLAIVGGYYLTQPASRFPSGMGPDVTRSSSVTVQAPVGDQSVAPERLEWQAVSGAVRYRVRLSEVDRHEIWSAEATATAIELPRSVRELIVPGKTLLWQVTAIDASNVAIADSALQQFRVAR